ncbi:GlsB/YeaQ/YmgE family stress response membrane protein [Mycobacterium tuberculosis]|nr:GlsB/YeaQ/YmgE family stress response membrane protein [Mycobacterium tuberculosis]
MDAWYDPVTIITAVIGSIIVLLIYGFVVGRRR